MITSKNKLLNNLFFPTSKLKPKSGN